jgi:hypothetical protein
VLAIVGVVALVALLLPASSGAVAGSPSQFESGDGNMVLNASLNTDWNCFQGTPGFQASANYGGTFTKADCKATTGATQTWADGGTTSVGSSEFQFKPGTKFDDPCVTINSGNNPNKDEWTNIAEYTEAAANSDLYFYGASIRQSTLGNSSGNVYFSQSTNGCHTPGDVLLAFNFLNGGGTPALDSLEWLPSGSPLPCFNASSAPCWGNDQQINTTFFDGNVNTTQILGADNAINGQTLPANAFAEFGINLTGALHAAGVTNIPCFANQTWVSRSSGSSFSSNPEDVEVVSRPTCGEIKIIKQTDPRGINQNFGFTSTIPVPGSTNSETCTTNPTSFTLNDQANTGKTLGSTDPSQNTGNFQDCKNVVLGNYTVNEGAEPNGFTFESVNCTTDSTSGSTVTTSGKTATINLKPQGLVTCVYINQLNTATLATMVSNAGPVFPAQAVHDTATVTGNQAADTPSGSVNFFLCGPIATGACDGTTNVGSSIGSGTLNGSGAVASAPSPDVNTVASPLTPGRYCFRAEWSGDNNYPGTLKEFGGANGTNECFTVKKIPTTTQTTPSVGSGGTTTFGSSVTDHALISATQPGGGTPTGSVTFFVCNPTQTVGGACPDPNGTQVGNAGVPTTAVSGSNPPQSQADSSAITANMTGTWCFRAVYTPGGANGNNYIGSSDASSGECFTVTDSTGSTSLQDWLPNDTATVTPAHGAPLNGTLSAQLYTEDNCGVTSGAAVSGQLYQKTLTNATSAADTTVTTNNNSYKVKATANVSWLITFTSTDPNVTGSNHCEVSNLTINN